MVRKHKYPARPDDRGAWERLAADSRTDIPASELLAAYPGLAAELRRGRGSGRIRAAGALAALPGLPDDSPEPPGALLDEYPWARSWGAFLNAVGDRDDEAGAQAVIRRVMDSRPRDAMAERIPSEGGFLVPERLRAQVLAYMTAAAVRPRATVITMDSLRVPVPVLDNPTQASSAQALGGLTFSMVEEGAAIPATTPSFGRLALEARKFAAYLQSVPNELVADATPFTADFLPRVIAMGWAWDEDDLFIYTGTGVGQPQALVNAPGAVTVNRSTSSKVLDTDLAGMLKSLHPASKTTATWLISEDAFDQLIDLYFVVGTGPSGQDITPSPLLEFDPVSGCWRLYGLPAVVNDHQPAVGTTGDVMLADLGLYLVGDRQELLIERSARGAGWASDTSNFRIKARIDGRFWPQQTYTLANGKVVSPLVILN